MSSQANQATINCMDPLANCLLTVITFNHMPYSESPQTQVSQPHHSPPSALKAIGMDAPHFLVVDVNLRCGSTHVTGAQALWILYV